jgi:hypothetical protein
MKELFKMKQSNKIDNSVHKSSVVEKIASFESEDFFPLRQKQFLIYLRALCNSFFW